MVEAGGRGDFVVCCEKKIEEKSEMKWEREKKNKKIFCT